MSGATTFQNAELQKFGEAIYDVVENQLCEAISAHLGCGRYYEEKDNEGLKVPYTFSDLFHKLRESGHNVDHRVSERRGQAVLIITISKDVVCIEKTIKTSFNVGLEDYEAPVQPEAPSIAEAA